MNKAIHPEQSDLFQVESSKGNAALSRDEQLKATQLFLQRKFAAFVERAEKVKASLLKESLTVLFAVQKSLMTSFFAKATEDKLAFM